MRLSQMTIRLGETIPTAQFANVRPEVELTVTLDPTDDPATVKSHLKGMAMRALEELKADMLGIRPGHKEPAPTVPAGALNANPPVVPQAATLTQSGISGSAGIPAVEPATW